MDGSQHSPFSYWQQAEVLRADYLVIGGGIVGLTAAATIAEVRPKARVVILDSGQQPDGATARNAGFACFGSPSELLMDLERQSADQVAQLVELRYRGLQRLRDRLSDSAIGYDTCGGFELLGHKQSDVPDKLADLNRMLRVIFREDPFLPHADWGDWPFDRQAFSSAISLPFEGSIDTGKLALALMRRATLAGVRWAGGAKVRSIEEQSEGLLVRATGNGGAEQVWRASLAAVCTNGYTAELLPDLPIKPGRGQVLITRPLPGLNLRGVFHMDRGYFYFRSVGQRLLLGGGRNLDMKGETTTQNGTNPAIASHLERLLHQTLLPGSPAPIESRWSGVMGFTDTGLPLLQRLGPRLAIGAGLNGMGVALGSLVGEAVADELLNRPPNAMQAFVNSRHEP